MQTNVFKRMLPIAIFGYAFLYVPLFIVMLFSFNKAKLINIWTGFSLRWYAELFANTQIMEALLTSLQIAFLSATMAVILGTLSAFTSVRLRRFWGSRVVSGLATAPLVIPDVMIGLSLLILYVWITNTLGISGHRGIFTITMAHATLGLAYVFILIRSRLMNFEIEYEEAALDLGARPLKVFWTITVPIIRPALISGWVLAFILSFDDVVLSSFLSGPGSTTLPMIIFSSVRLGISPMINALATLMIGVIFLGVIIAYIFYNRSKKVA